MTSQIRKCIEYLILTDNILVLILHSNLIFKNLALLTGFQKDLIIMPKCLTFYWATLLHSSHKTLACAN